MRWDRFLGIKYSPDLKLFRAKGCAKCNNSGYKGRMGIHELLVGTDDMKRSIQKRESVEKMREQAQRDGMTTLLQDGIAKVLKGMSDFKSVRAVCIKQQQPAGDPRRERSRCVPRARRRQRWS